MSGRWADAAFTQEHILGTVKHNPAFRDYMENFQSDAFPEAPEGLMLMLQERTFEEADPMYVSSVVAELVDHARETFEVEPLQPWDLPCMIAFALLPRPLNITNLYGHDTSFRAISWIPVSRSSEVGWSEDNPPQGVWYTLWSDIDDPDAYKRDDKTKLERAIWERIGKWSVLHSGLLEFGEEAYGFFGMNNKALLDSLEGEPEYPQAYSRVQTWVFLQSFWRLSRQVVLAKERLPRQLRRDRKRHYRSEDVTVIRLRRESHEHDHDVEDVDWKYQWVVRGHWRNQYYPGLGPVHNDDGTLNKESHRQIWISPYMKGPEDAPVKPVKRAFEFTR